MTTTPTRTTTDSLSRYRAKRDLSTTPAPPGKLSPTKQKTRRASRSPGGVEVSHPDRVIDSSTGLRKIDLVRYYEEVSGHLAVHLKGRPCSLMRGPAGIEGPLFFQKHASRVTIPGVRNLDAALWPEHDPLLEVGTPKAIVSAAQMNVVEFHTWNSKVNRINAPDRIVFDLDPGEDVTWTQVQQGARLVRSLLSELGLESWLKTSGGKGLHVVVPLTPRAEWDTVAEFSKAAVKRLAEALPDRFASKSGASNRVGKVFVDYLRNGLGATTAAAFSARARPGLGVSMPIGWDALDDIGSGSQWTITNTLEHLSSRPADPWEGYWRKRQTLTLATKRLRAMQI